MNVVDLTSLFDENRLPSAQYAEEFRIFAEVAKSRSFSAAADRLGLSRATVARKLRRLQDLSGVELFASGKHGVRLTKQGEQLAGALVFDPPPVVLDHSNTDVVNEGHVRKILDVYAHFKTKPGEALVSDHFLGVGRLRRWDVNDMQRGIEEAHRSGWVERAALGWRLTEAGFKEATRPL